MYYLITEYELPVLLTGTTRKLITMGNRNCFTDMYDDNPLNGVSIIPEETFKDFMKDGFFEKSDAKNATELKKAITDFIGMFFTGDFKVVSEDELIKKYKTQLEKYETL